MEVKNFVCDNCGYKFVRQIKKNIKCPKCRSLRVSTTKPLLQTIEKTK